MAEFVMASVTDVYGHTEAEMVTIEDYGDGQVIKFGLDDGRSLVFIGAELMAVLPKRELRAA